MEAGDERETLLFLKIPSSWPPLSLSKSPNA
jgi:hypothetical protein